MIEQIQRIIVEVGYWDVSAGNLPIILQDGKGFGCLDFENIKNERLDEQVTTGLTRLAFMIPIPTVIDRAKERLAEGFANLDDKDSTIEKRKASFEESVTVLLQQLSSRLEALDAYEACVDAESDRKRERSKICYPPKQLKDKRQLANEVLVYHLAEYKNAILISEKKDKQISRLGNLCMLAIPTKL